MDPQQSPIPALLAEHEHSVAFQDPFSCRATMIALVTRLPLTPVERSWLATAREFLVGSITPQDLEAAREEAWESLGDRSCEFADPAVNRTRAVICTLSPDIAVGDELDEFTTVSEFFLDAGGDRDLLIRLLAATQPNAP